MGVEFFPCDYCGESICDCGNYISCNDDCSRRWCDIRCAKKDGYQSPPSMHPFEEDTTCSFCRLEKAEDSQLLDYLLKKYKLSREDVERKYLSHIKSVSNVK